MSDQQRIPIIMTPTSNSDEFEPQVWPPKDSITNRYLETRERTACEYVVSKKNLGDGSFAVVKECKNIVTGQHYALKLIKKRLMNGREQVIQKEYEVLRKISRGHPNILTLVDYFETSDEIALVTDLCTGGDLFDRILTKSLLLESDVAKYMKILCGAVKFLHDKGIVHRDLKAENILFKNTSDDSSLMIADFGMAEFLSPGEKLHVFGGTLSYIAPEIISKEGYSFPIDIWSLGVLTYFMLCGYMPFDCETDDETKEAIKGGVFYLEPEDYWGHISDEAKDFVTKCFTVDQTARPTIDDLLSHPFIARIPSSRSFNLMPMVRSNVDLHKMTSPMMSPSHSHSNSDMTDYFGNRNSQSLRNLRDVLHQSLGATVAPQMSPMKRMDSAVSIIEMARRVSVQHDGMNGRLCYTPETRSVITSPVMSRNSSRSSFTRSSSRQSINKAVSMKIHTSLEESRGQGVKFFM